MSTISLYNAEKNAKKINKKFFMRFLDIFLKFFFYISLTFFLLLLGWTLEYVNIKTTEFNFVNFGIIAKTAFNNFIFNIYYQV